MGKVWRVYDNTLHRSVAIKTLHQNCVSILKIEKIFHRRSDRSTTSASRIVPIYEFSNKLVTSFMKEIQGRTLKEIVTEFNRANERRKLDFSYKGWDLQN